ncbi:ankyrin repeat and BTB/POZ domain-containing protein 2-like [Saccoglossus kowalevskii]|uniref:Ankyrin repeat and BTB/POZ domain-containing protein 2-like n=1 Tax=Saccoglossus kowalevskii TaxID=10224 RepID=A0ABM0MV89_SACKO|nr:PREDICTED: ankyrin repeat and BTB/POZ domain-containing protein 2-like [Saccoglossus kowalevskii]
MSCFHSITGAFETLTMDTNSHSGGSSGASFNSHYSSKSTRENSPHLAPLEWEHSRHGSFDTLNTSIPDEMEFIDKYYKIVELEKTPWTDVHVKNVLQSGSKSRQLSRKVPYVVVQRISYLLQRPLVRIARETQRLCSTYGKCTKHEIHTAIKLILSRSLAESCLAASVKALSNFQMNPDHFRIGKKTRSGLIFPVGKFHRWLVDTHVSSRVNDHAAVYLTACMEGLAEEMFFRAFHGNIDELDEELTVEMLDFGISNDPDLWGISQTCEHLICGRNANGILSLTSSPLSGNSSTRSSSSGSDYSNQSRGYGRKCEIKTNGSLEVSKHLEQNLLATCVGSIAELGKLDLKLGDGWMYVFSNRNLNQTEIMEECFVIVAWKIKIILNRYTPVRALLTDESICSSRHLDASACAASFQLDLAFRMLACGRTDLVQQAIAMLGPAGINALNEQGMTPLMFACARGDEAMVQVLIDAHSDLDITVPSNPMYPCVHPAIRHWTALTFATANSHIPVVQLLLEAGAYVDGAVDNSFNAETPLQMAAAAGHYELVSLLLARGADPYLFTLDKSNANSGYLNSFALAASHGHRNVLRRLLSQPHVTKSSDFLSLEEILAEGTDTGYKAKKLDNTKTREAALQEAMYHSCEHGYLDVSMELRSLGVQWSLHCWTETLSTAKQLRRKAIIQCLLRDFCSIQPNEYNEEFCDEALPLMFDIFRQCKNEVISQQLAAVFSLVYGYEPLPEIKAINFTPPARIDPQYVNNPDMSDVTFIVEGRPFYAHKIILVTASKRFKALLSDKMNESTTPCVEINDFRYHVFKVMAAANYFYLDGLQRHCEILCSKLLLFENAVKIYKHAKLYNARALMEYCECYFLANMTELLDKSDHYKKLVFNSKLPTYDVIQGLQQTLTHRILLRQSTIV